MNLIDFVKNYLGDSHIISSELNDSEYQLLSEIFKEYPKVTEDDIDLALVILKAKDACLCKPLSENMIKKSGLYYVRFYKDFFVTNKKELIAKFEKNTLNRTTPQNTHRNTGLILGYPKCCVDSFIKRRDTFFEKDIVKQFPKKVGFDKFLSHVKCREKCSASTKLAKQYAAAIKKAVPKFYLHKLTLGFCLNHLNEI